ELVGDLNIYIFGEDSDTVIKRYEEGSYCARNYYENDAEIRAAIDFITSEAMLEVGSREHLERLKNELINKDWFMTLPDFKSYVAAKERAYEEYENRIIWAKKMIMNISKAGYFSSDRTIEEYNRDIWHLEQE
ncbi:MAG: glycogen/starch/alpha-glucan phosphorylase, partial [Clostridia bacterium]|nr:glycogen/starch/alpha-glucan phosphorylase [Clostridia bacterium]